MQAKTETETIERALDLAIAEHQKNRITAAAHERFFKSGIEIKDFTASYLIDASCAL